MKSVTQIAAEIVAREGGYVDDPDDPGGATKHGVTLGTLRRLGRDLTGDGRVDEMDIRALDPGQAAEIFIEHYYKSPRIDRLPPSVQASVFDMYVNAGGNAVVILQRLLGDMGQRVVVDGIIGPQTIAAAELADAAAPGYFADAYGIARRNYYYRIADARPASRKYATTRAGGKGGWIRRAEEFISPRFHLTEGEHRKRVAKWA
ncbi:MULTISPECIES: holin-associated N-acetylmuramidase [Thioclava]|uniref:Peptidoglycan-binding protein n=1 Tax=Thioclava electrotropha TaxID=1549850 RepID=A0ABX6YPW7_9RHOB|nr:MULTISPECIES: holin-associated N-acetylmuramidase [Thioclava]MAQ35621.1 peptidoglycan-binding protein [Thioclava sp.]OOY04465.1 peptidoglycan-binding protein [Thioclava sp. F28-4]QPZ89770.1 peptidoglycan-binding protein [Thioclava electrotropha]